MKLNSISLCKPSNEFKWKTGLKLANKIYLRKETSVKDLLHGKVKMEVKINLI